MNKTQKIVFFIVFSALFIFLLGEGNREAAGVLFFVLILGVIGVFHPRFEEDDTDEDDSTARTSVNEIHHTSALIYHGDELKFTDEQIHQVLIKYSPYYNELSTNDKPIFLQRLKKFIAQKIFYIHDESGFIEMPILISATAIQLTFGLDKFLLPNFDRIHIYPEEFIGVHPTLRILEGNVSGHCVNLSWKHFLKGFTFPNDGQNTGLHEFAHAYYYQYFETGESVDKEFTSYYPAFEDHGKDALLNEQKEGFDLYTDYGLKNSQEFWAESVELFFEKPEKLKAFYPSLYNSIMLLLNQDPINKKVKFI